MSSPLARASSLKVKLGALVGISVLVATVVATAGASSRVTPWLVVPVTIAVALGVTQWLASGMTAPLRAMTSATRRMAKGDYSARIDATGNDEVADLARAFTSMATDLRDADQHRRELIATVSHELRTPAAALRALLENMADGVTAPDESALGAALHQSERLSDLLGELLSLSRLDAGLADLRLEPVLVSRLLAEVRDELAASGRDVSTQIRVTPSDLTVHAETARLRQAVSNLLDNAARHTAPGTTVVLAARRASESAWELDVLDHGPGIPPADRERIFERFGTASAGGTGLGLAIARWVAELHGGSVVALDPDPGSGGALLRLALPLKPPPRVHPESIAGERMPSAPPPAAPPAPREPAPRPIPTSVAPNPYLRGPSEPVIDGLFGKLWPETQTAGRPGLVALAAAIGALAALLLPDRNVGIAWSLVLLTSGTAIVLNSRRRSPVVWAVMALGLGLAAIATVRAAEWLVPLSMLTGGLLIVIAIAPVTSVWGVFAAAAAWPVSGLRGLPWLGRSLSRSGRSARTFAIARTVVLSVLALVIFGALFASADAIFGHWVDVLIPDLTVDNLIARLFVWAAFGGLTLAGIYLAVNPIRDEALNLPAGRPVRHSWEWLVPVGLVVATYIGFIAAQASAWLGGHDYVQSATGLTYADYVHQGFGQLTVATALTLAVVALTARKATRADEGDRLLLRAVLGLLCVLTLAVVASALWRMHLYQQAFGYTTLRLIVDFFEIWVALIVIMVLIAGISFSGKWIPTAAILCGAALVLVFAGLNPDAWVAQRNLDRYATTGKVDLNYLRSLSADAAPVIARSNLPEPDRLCVLAHGPGANLTGDDALEWNLGRSRARTAVAGLDLSAAGRGCETAYSSD